MSEQRSKQENELFDPSRLLHMGVVVKNIDETIKYYERVFGFGPFEILQVDFPNATYHGEVAGYKGKRAGIIVHLLLTTMLEFVQWMVRTYAPRISLCFRALSSDGCILIL